VDNFVKIMSNLVKRLNKIVKIDFKQIYAFTLFSFTF
jgi:hypothetical protein